MSEKICLSSRDDDIVLIVSYAELKRCVDMSFSQLTSHHSAANNSTTTPAAAASAAGGFSQ